MLSVIFFLFIYKCFLRGIHSHFSTVLKLDSCVVTDELLQCPHYVKVTENYEVLKTSLL